MQVSKIDNQHYRMCNHRKARNRLENIDRSRTPCSQACECFCIDHCEASRKNARMIAGGTVRFKPFCWFVDFIESPTQSLSWSHRWWRGRWCMQRHKKLSAVNCGEQRVGPLVDSSRIERGKVDAWKSITRGRRKPLEGLDPWFHWLRCSKSRD